MERRHSVALEFAHLVSLEWEPMVKRVRSQPSAIELDMRLKGVGSGGMEGDVKSYSVPPCFSCHSGLWVIRECLLKLGARRKT